MKKDSDKLTTRINKEDKAILKVIKKETNNLITPRYILQEFIKEYCETEPKGIKISIKELEKNIKEIDKQMHILKTDKHNLELKLKTYKDKLNKTLDMYIDEDLNNAVKSIITIYNQHNYMSFDEIPEQTFIEIAKYHKLDWKTLKEEVKKKF